MLSDSKTAGFSAYSRQYLYLGTLAEIDRDRQLARFNAIFRKLPLYDASYVLYDSRRRLILQRSLVHDQKHVHIAETRYVRPLIDRTSELGLYCFMACPIQRLADDFQPPRHARAVSALVFGKQLFAIAIEVEL